MPPASPSSQAIPPGIVRRLAGKNGAGSGSMTTVKKMALERETKSRSPKKRPGGVGGQAPQPSTGNTALMNRTIAARRGRAPQPLAANSSDTTISSLGGNDRYAAAVDRQLRSAGRQPQQQSDVAGGGLGSAQRTASILKAAHGYMSGAGITPAAAAARADHRAQTAVTAVSGGAGGGGGHPPTTPRHSNGTAAASPSAPQATSWDLPSLVSESNTFDSADAGVTESALYRKFEEAFNLTLRDNPGILPGAPAVVDSIKSALQRAARRRAAMERELRDQLDRTNAEMHAAADSARREKSTMESRLGEQVGRVKRESDRLESDLRKEMAAASVRRTELTKALEMARAEQERTEAGHRKQIGAIETLRREVMSQKESASSEEKELRGHLEILSKSRAELESALTAEMELVEKDRSSLQALVEERKRLKDQKAENKELEGKVEKLSRAAAEEKRALQVEIADLQKFEKHLEVLKQQNEKARKDLEAEQAGLKSTAEALQTKKNSILETKDELEKQFQAEIDELEAQISQTKMMHEDQMESIVKTRVMGFLKSGGDVPEPRPTGEDDEGDAAPEGPVDIQEQIRKGVDEEVRRIKEEEEEAAKREREEAERQAKEAQLSETINKLNGEMERMRKEHEQKEEEKRKAAEDKKEKEAEKIMLREIDELKAQLAEERKAKDAGAKAAELAEEMKAMSAAIATAARDETSEDLRSELEELRDMKASLMQEMEGYAAPAPPPRRYAAEPAPLPSPRRYAAEPAPLPSPRRYRAETPRDDPSPPPPRYYERPGLDRHRPSPSYRDEGCEFVADYDHERKVPARSRLRAGLPPSSPRFGSRGLASPRMASSPRHEVDDDMTYTRQVMSPRHRPLSRSRGRAGRYSFGSRFE